MTYHSGDMPCTTPLTSGPFSFFGRVPALERSPILGRRITLCSAGVFVACVVLTTPASAETIDGAKPKASSSPTAVDAKEEASSDAEAQPDEAEPAEVEPPAEEGASEGEGAAELGADAVLAVETGAAVSTGMRNRIGIGAMRTLGGANAIRVSWYAIDKLSVSALIGFATYTHEAQDSDGGYTKKETYGLLAAGGDVLYWPVQGDRSRSVYADFGVGFRTTVFTGIRPPPEEETGRRTKPMEVNIEIPVSLPIWFGQNVTVTPEFGFTARIVPGSQEPDTNGNVDQNVGQGTAERLGTTSVPGWGVEFGDNGGLFFGLSFAYVFGG